TISSIRGCVVHHSKNGPQMAEMGHFEPPGFLAAMAELAAIADMSEASAPSTVGRHCVSRATERNLRRPTQSSRLSRQCGCRTFFPAFQGTAQESQAGSRRGH